MEGDPRVPRHLADTPNRKNRDECKGSFKNRTGRKEACREQMKPKESPPVDLRVKMSHP